MTLDDRLAIARSLIARRDAIDTELELLFTGATVQPKPRRRRQPALTASQDAETSNGEAISKEQPL